MNTFVRMIRSRSGVSAAEYAMILAVIGSIIAVSAMSLGGAIAASIGETTQQLEDCRAGTC